MGGNSNVRGAVRSYGKRENTFEGEIDMVKFVQDVADGARVIRMDVAQLLVDWTLERLGGHRFCKLLPQLTELGTLLKGLRYTARDQLEFNDLDNHAWLIPHDKKTVFVLESQSRRKLVIVERNLINMQVHARRVWYQHDEDRNHFWRKLLPLRWYREHDWTPEYGDCRDAGYITTYKTWPNAKVDGAAYYWGELESLRFDVNSTLCALKEGQTVRLSQIRALEEEQ